MKDNKGNKTGSKSCVACEKPVVNIDNEYVVQQVTVQGDLVVVDTVAELRSLSQQYIQVLISGKYKGVQLLGYYSKGDTPAPIEYYLSDTTESDDGGSIFEVGGIKLEHDFRGIIDPLYYGAQTGLTQSMINKSDTVYKISKNLSSTVNISLPVNTTLSFTSNVTTLNSIVTFNSGSKIVGGENVTIRGRATANLDVAVNNKWVDPDPVTLIPNTTSTYELVLTEDLTFDKLRQINLVNANSSFFIRGNGFKITTSFLLEITANTVYIENVEFDIRAGGQLNFAANYITSANVTLKNCKIIGQTGVAGKMFYGRQPILENEQINKQLNIVIEDCYIDNVPVHLNNGGLIHINRTTMIQGSNTQGNNLLLQINNPRLTQCIIENSRFFANGLSNDLIDFYNSSNAVVTKNYFEGFFATGVTAFVHVKSHGTQVDPLPYDDLRTYNVLIDSNTFKLTGRGSAIWLGNDVRDNSIPILEKYKRVFNTITNNTFIFDGVDFNLSSAIFSHGSLYHNLISQNKHYIKGIPSTLITLIFLRLVNNSTTGENLNYSMILSENQVYIDLEDTNPLTYEFLRTERRVFDSVISGNQIPSDKIFCTTVNRLVNTKIFGNTFDPLKTFTTAMRPSLDYFLDGDYGGFDTTINKAIYRKNSTTWVDATGAEV